MWRNGAAGAQYSESLALDMSSVVPSLAGPKRPQDRVPLSASKPMFAQAFNAIQKEAGLNSKSPVQVRYEDQSFALKDGCVVIAAITSCTNTSNPMLGAGLVAKKAVALGVKVKPWVKTSLAPGSLVVTEYLKHAGLLDDLEALGFHVVGYGCTTCIGNSGPLPEPIAKAINENDLTAVSVLSGNRNFEGRVHADVRMNYLASPPLVVAYAIAGRMDIDVHKEALATGLNGREIFLKDIWPTQKEVADTVSQFLTVEQFTKSYTDLFAGDANWASLEVTESQLYEWQESTYVANPPYFENMTAAVGEVSDIHGARALAYLGDSVTTDHISPAGAIKADSPAGKYLQEKGVEPTDFNSYGSRRGNHEVMMRGTFANIRLRNKIAPGTEGGVTRHQPSGTEMTIYDAAMQYRQEGVAAIILAGKEYGCGSSRDWAAKGPRLQGVKAVIAESYERIHRSNLVGMGILPLQFKAGESAAAHGLTGTELFDITGLKNATAKTVNVTATGSDGKVKSFAVTVRIDTPQEIEYYQNGGILHYVLRQLAC